MAAALAAPVKRTTIAFEATKVVVEYSQRLGGWDMKHVYKNMDLILANGQRLPSGGTLEARITVGHVREDLSDVHFSVHEVIYGKPVKLLYKTTLCGAVRDLAAESTNPVLLEHIQTVEDGGELSIHQLKQALVLLLTDAKRLIEMEGAIRINTAHGKEMLATVIQDAPPAERPKAPYTALHDARRDRREATDKAKMLSEFMDGMCDDIKAIQGTELTREGE